MSFFDISQPSKIDPFAFVAQNIGTRWYALKQTPLWSEMRDAQQLYAVALINSYTYLAFGAFTQNDIKKAMFDSLLGRVRLRTYSVIHEKDMSDLNDEEYQMTMLLALTMQLEEMMFNVKGSVDYHDIVDAVIKKKQIIKEFLYQAIETGPEALNYDFIMSDTLTHTENENFKQVVLSYGSSQP